MRAAKVACACFIGRQKRSAFLLSGTKERNTIGSKACLEGGTKGVQRHGMGQAGMMLVFFFTACLPVIIFTCFINHPHATAGHV